MSNRKFLDQAGVQYLWSQLSLKDYPNNETLIAVLNAIDETKVDKFIDHIVIDDYTVTFHFTNGIAIKKKYTNGPSGNQKGWKNKKLNQMEG